MQATFGVRPLLGEKIVKACPEAARTFVALSANAMLVAVLIIAALCCLVALDATSADER